MAGGRPSKYDPAFCDRAREFLAEGYSFAGLAGELGISRQTLVNWGEKHPEFLDALKEGSAASAYWWEKTLRSVATTGEGSAAAAIFGLKNRARDDWTDTQRHEHTGANGQPIEISDTERAKRIAQMLVAAQNRKDGGGHAG